MKTNAVSLSRTLSLAVLTALLLTTTAHAQPAFHLIGNPTGLISEVSGLSRGGSVACGTNRYGTTVPDSSFRWTFQGGRQDFFTAASSGADGVSADGSILVGGARTSASEIQPYRQSADGTVQFLGFLPGFKTGGGGSVSADGSTVIGGFYNSNASVYRPFRWTASGGMQPLAGLNGNNTFANDISDDGKTVIGTYSPSVSSGEYKAFIWNEASGTRYLPGFNGDYGVANGCTPDTSVVVGRTTGLVRDEACRWDGDKVSLLGLIGDWRASIANAVSDDGKVITGQLFDSPTHVSYTTFVWTETTGMMESVDYFRMMGVPLPVDGSYDYTVRCVSGDGLSFGGVMGRFGNVGFPAQGFIASVPAPGLAFLCPVLVIIVAHRRRSSYESESKE